LKPLLPRPSKFFIALAGLMSGFLLIMSFGAQADEAFPTLTPELMDGLNESMDTAS